MYTFQGKELSLITKHCFILLQRMYAIPEQESLEMRQNGASYQQIKLRNVLRHSIPTEKNYILITVLKIQPFKPVLSRQRMGRVKLTSADRWLLNIVKITIKMKI